MSKTTAVQTLIQEAAEGLYESLSQDPVVKGGISYNRTGGFLSVTNRYGKLIFQTSLGNPEEKLAPIFQQRSVEYARKLAIQPSRKLLPWENNEMWTAAVRGKKYIFSFSGFHNLLGSIFLVILIVRIGDMNWKNALRLLKAERNSYVDQYIHDEGGPFLRSPSWILSYLCAKRRSG